MRPTSIQIHGFKRFAEPTTLRLRARSTAVLGPNEVGKTSLLEAIAHLGHNGFDQTSDFTDREERAPGDTVVSAQFALDQDDLSAVAEALKGRRVINTLALDTTYSLSKRADGTRNRVLPGVVQRDPAIRREFAALTASLLEPETWDTLPETPNATGQKTGVREMAAKLVDTFERTPAPANASAAVVRRLTDLLGAVTAWVNDLRSPPVALTGWRDEINTMLDEERAEDPWALAAGILARRIPQFLLFGDDERQVPGYTPFSASAPASLENVLTAAGTSWRTLKELAERNDRQALGVLERRINRRLEQLFEQWTQRRGVSLIVDIHAEGIEVKGRDRDAPVIDVPVAQRSAGMRIFGALLAFVHAKRDKDASPPVLLVDEAEMHLHYDAQADLVRVFDRQRVASGIIYTTHSIGCLPEDLGVGVAVVQPSGDERSRLSQSYWSGGPGFTPIVTALGAAVFAFTPARRVLIGEGAHEAMLLPRLLREARGSDDLEPLGFQIVGGLSEVAKSDVAELEEQAGTVLYLVDNDDAGRDIRRKLPATVRDAGRVLTLGEGTDAVTIEDFISPAVLVGAMDAVAEAGGIAALARSAEEVPPNGRGLWAEGELNGAGVPGARTRLAIACLEHATDDGLMDRDRQEPLAALLTQIRAKFPAS